MLYVWSNLFNMLIIQNINFIVKKRFSHNLRCGSIYNHKIISKLKAGLKKEGFKIFHRICFGPYLKILKCNFQGSVSRCLVTLEAKHNICKCNHPQFFNL